MSAMQATVSCGLSQVSVTARMSTVLEINNSLSDAVLLHFTLQLQQH